MRADAIAKGQFIVGRPRLLPENIRIQDGRPSAPQSWMRCNVTHQGCTPRPRSIPRVSFFGPWGALVPPLGRRKLASMFERLCFGFVAAKHRLELGGNLGNTRIALGVKAMGIYRKM